MKIQLVTFLHELSRKQRLKNTIEILNNSKADFVLFAGHTLEFVNDIETLREKLENKKITALIELRDINSAKINNCLFKIENGEVINLFTNQLFATSNDINGNYELASRLIDELETKRKFKLKGLTFLTLQCGELNILKNIQSERNRVEFRLIDDVKLTKQFKTVLKDVDVLLNPMHTPMGNQGKMKKRRDFLSAKNRHYFSVSNTSPKSPLKLKLNGLQYAIKNSTELEERISTIQKTYIIKEFEM